MFPTRDYGPETVMFRSHSSRYAPWWFSSSGEGRFDLAAPNGTCYTAETEVVTLLETWGGMQVVPDYLVAQRATSRLCLSHTVRVADMTSNAAIQYGVTAEIFTTSDYRITQLWAAALHQAGFGGIRYWARHDLAHTAACLAMFGSTGTDSAPIDLEGASTEQLSNRPDLLSALENETGIAVLPAPPI